MPTLNACTGVLTSLMVSGACPIRVGNGTLCGMACARILINRNDMDVVGQLVQIGESLM